MDSLEDSPYFCRLSIVRVHVHPLSSLLLKKGKGKIDDFSDFGAMKLCVDAYTFIFTRLRQHYVLVAQVSTKVLNILREPVAILGSQRPLNTIHQRHQALNTE